MNKNDLNTQDFQKLIEKYLDGKTTLEEVKQLVNYYESFQENNEWVEELGPERNIKNRMLINILEAIQEEDVKIIPLYKRNIFKYGVAASLILFVSFNFIFNKNNKLINDSSSTPKTIHNNIAIGTDKAILTLEDGTIIPLEKGKKYVANSVSSNGEEIIYNTTATTNPEIAYNYLTIPRGGQYHVKLSDGTNVWLNSESKLKYPVNFTLGRTREVELVYGEAYFEVSPSTEHSGAKFKIHSGAQEVEVLGTEFNIKAYQDENFIYTTLVEGKVSVDNVNMQTQILKPSEQAVFNSANFDIIISEVDVNSEIAWRKGLFSFKDKSLKDIMKVLSRWYDVEVVFVNKDLEGVHFKGVLSKNQNIEEILKLIKNTNFINTYDIDNKTIIIRN